jgi:hypothetical protein
MTGFWLFSSQGAWGVLANDFDLNGTALTVWSVIPPQHVAAFELRADGSFSYQPQPGHAGPKSFTYRLSDGRFTDDGTASGYGYNVYYTPGPTFGCGPGKSSTDRFTYTIRDSYGQTASTTVTVYAVQVSGYTVEWQKPDGTWQPLGDDDVSWVGDQLRWTPQYSFDPQYFAGSSLWRKPYSEPSGWARFATGGSEVFTGADMGQWSVQAEARFAGMPWQSGFAARQESQGRRLTAEVTSIQWTAHTANPTEAGDVVPTGEVVRFFPDAVAPGQAARPKVDVLVQVAPQLPNIPVELRLWDVDDPDHDGPIDQDPFIGGGQGTNPRDNFQAGGTIAPLPPIAASLRTDATGRVRAELNVGAIQPGNNFRVVAGSHADVVNRVKALSFDADARLFYDHNDDDIHDPFWGLEPVIDHVAGHRGMKATPELEVWRRLHVEVDSMGPVQGNTVHATSGQVANNGDGTYTVPVNVAHALEVNRFENGGLQDLQGYVYPIVDNTESSLRVRQGNNPAPPSSNGDVWFWDDDQLHDGQDVPMPDTSELPNAMREAYVDVRYDVGDNDTNVPFIPNVAWTNDALVAAQRWNSVGLNATSYWVAYILGAFQSATNMDEDPDSEEGHAGGTPGVNDDRGGSLVFVEQARDLARQLRKDLLLLEQDVVVHEVGHAFKKHTEPVTLFPSGGPVRYIEDYLLAIRTVDKPGSR